MDGGEEWVLIDQFRVSLLEAKSGWGSSFTAPWTFYDRVSVQLSTNRQHLPKPWYGDVSVSRQGKRISARRLAAGPATLYRVLGRDLHMYATSGCGASDAGRLACVRGVYIPMWHERTVHLTKIRHGALKIAAWSKICRSFTRAAGRPRVTLVRRTASTSRKQTDGLPAIRRRQLLGAHGRRRHAIPTQGVPKSNRVVAPHVL
ncbi:hypothetical protein F4802DRAFT_193156 [Xylaria palmicola]|nr:hypothetical protein F4802DRAFT_193156 [Xylaria palmicola]